MPSRAKAPKLTITTTIPDYDIPRERIQGVFQQIMSDHDVTDGEVNIAIVDDEVIHSTNREFLDHDYPTDCISFVYDNVGRLEGEILVNAETADRVALETPWSGDDELMLYIIHGTLHLIGFDDQDPDSAQQMRLYERHYMMQLGVEGAEFHGLEDEDVVDLEGEDDDIRHDFS